MRQEILTGLWTMLAVSFLFTAWGNLANINEQWYRTMPRFLRPVFCGSPLYQRPSFTERMATSRKIQAALMLGLAVGSVVEVLQATRMLG